MDPHRERGQDEQKLEGRYTADEGTEKLKRGCREAMIASWDARGAFETQIFGDAPRRWDEMFPFGPVQPEGRQKERW